jgi:hypothetical protein
VIDQYMQKVRAVGDSGWTTEMDARDLGTVSTKAAPDVELKRASLCADWAVRTVLVDTLIQVDCATTASRFAALGIGRDPAGLRVLENAIKSLAENGVGALTSGERARLTNGERTKLFRVAHLARSALSMARMGPSGNDEAAVEQHWGRLAGYAVQALEDSGSTTIRPGNFVDVMAATVA